jgi:hypothetical protein
MDPALWGVAAAIVFHSVRSLNMADFSRLTAAVEAVANEVADVAKAIRNPADDNVNQDAADALALRLETAAESLRSAKAEEEAEDKGGSPPAAA